MDRQERLLFLLLLPGFLYNNCGLPVVTGSEEDTLKSVQILFRHGDRTPDIGDMIGVGHLTEKGKLEAYDLGVYLRQKYGKFLPNEYNPDDTKFVSSDKDRTIQSSLLVAYGLYEDFNANASWIGERSLPYEPIPVRHIPEKYDKYLQMTKYCPRRDQLIEESVAEFTLKFMSENPEVINLYGSKKENVSLFDPNRAMLDRLNPLIAFQDEIMYNISHNLPIEDWCKVLIGIENYFGIKTGYYRSMVDTTEKQKFYNGPLVQLVTDKFRGQSPTKMTIYCLHDKTLFTFMVTLGIEDRLALLLPPTTAALMMELHENGTASDGPYLKLTYRNTTEGEPHILQIPGCGDPCHLSTFISLKKEVMPENFEVECQYMPSNFEISGDYTFYLWVGAFLIVAVFGLTLFCTARSDRYEKII